MKIILRAPFSQSTGYGKDGIGLARALMDRGHDVRVSPSHVGIPIPRDIAGLFTYPQDAPFDLAIHHLEPMEVELLGSDAKSSRRNLYWSMWEWETLPPQDEWVKTFQDRIALFDYVVAYDSGSYGAFKPYVEEGKLFTVQGGFQAKEWEVAKYKVENESFIFAMNGNLNLRKGVYTAYSAFLQLKEKYGEDFNARLVLKSIAPIFPPKFDVGPDISVIVDIWMPDKLKTFYQQIDCLLCPSWGEGKNLPALEALACGTPVVLSDIPAHRQWAHSDIVTWAKTEPMELMVSHKGGYVSPEALAEVMWYQYNNRPAERLKAQRAAAEVVKSMDWSKSVERLGLATGLLL